MSIANKVQDTNILPVAQGGRADRHWNKNPMRDFTNKRANLKAVPDPMNQAQKFSLKGFEFGNWTTPEDRANFMTTASRSLPTFANLIGFRSEDVGLAYHVGIAYGARGTGSAVAHYEPGTGMINLTRYPDGEQKHYFNSGGMQSFAHEWGHALDYFLGTYLDQHSGSRALTTGRTVIKKPSAWRNYESMNLEKGSYRAITREILATILFSERGKTFTPYMGNLVRVVERSPLIGTYWIQWNEIFARAFEQYISLKAKGKGLKNTFLVKQKYVSSDLARSGFHPYMGAALLKKVEPLFDQLLKKAANDLNSMK